MALKISNPTSFTSNRQNDPPDPSIWEPRREEEWRWDTRVEERRGKWAWREEGGKRGWEVRKWTEQRMWKEYSKVTSS